MLDKGKTVVTTIHKGSEMQSPYIKLTIEDNLEQLANFMASVMRSKSVRIFDQSQDELILEYKDGAFYYDPEQKELIHKLFREVNSILKGEKPKQTVRIHNFWMDEKFNNKEQIVQLIQTHDLKADYNVWEAVGRH